MAMRKFGAPATSHVKHITAEDVEVINKVIAPAPEKIDESKKKDDEDTAKGK